MAIPPATPQLPNFHTIGREPALLSRMNGDTRSASPNDMRVDDYSTLDATHEPTAAGSLFARIHGAPAADFSKEPGGSFSNSNSNSTISGSNTSEPARLIAGSSEQVMHMLTPTASTSSTHVPASYSGASFSPSPPKGKGKAKAATPDPGLLQPGRSLPFAQSENSNVPASKAPSTVAFSVASSSAPSTATGEPNPAGVLFNLLAKRRQSLAGVHTTLATRGQTWLAQARRTSTAGDALAARADALLAHADAVAAQAHRAREEAERADELAVALRAEADALRAEAAALREEHRLGVQNAEAVSKYTTRLGEWDVTTAAREQSAEAGVRAHIEAVEGAHGRLAGLEARRVQEDAARAEERGLLERVQAELEVTKKRVVALSLDKTKLEKANAAVLKAVAALREPNLEEDDEQRQAAGAQMDVDNAVASGSGVSQRAPLPPAVSTTTNQTQATGQMPTSAFTTSQPPMTAAAPPTQPKFTTTSKKPRMPAELSQFALPPPTSTSIPATAPTGPRSNQAQPFGTNWPGQVPPPLHVQTAPRPAPTFVPARTEAGRDTNTSAGSPPAPNFVPARTEAGRVVDTQRPFVNTSNVNGRGANTPAGVPPAPNNAPPMAPVAASAQTAVAAAVKTEPMSPVLGRTATLPPPRTAEAPSRAAAAAPATQVSAPLPPQTAQQHSALREPSPIGPQDDAPNVMPPDADSRDQDHHAHADERAGPTTSPTATASLSSNHQLPSRPQFRGEEYPRRRTSPEYSPTTNIPAKRPYANEDRWDERPARRRLSPDGGAPRSPHVGGPPPGGPYRVRQPSGNSYRPPPYRSPSPRREYDDRDRDYDRDRRRTASHEHHYSDMSMSTPSNSNSAINDRRTPSPPPRRAAHGNSYRPGYDAPERRRPIDDPIQQREQEAAQYKAALRARPPSPRRSPPPPPRQQQPYERERPPPPPQEYTEREHAMSLQDRIEQPATPIDGAPAPTGNRPMLEERISTVNYAQSASYHHSNNNNDNGNYRGGARGRGGGPGRGGGGGAQARGRGGASTSSYRGRGRGGGRGRSNSPSDNNPSLLNRIRPGA